MLFKNEVMLEVVDVSSFSVRGGRQRYPSRFGSWIKLSPSFIIRKLFRALKTARNFAVEVKAKKK